MFVKLYKYHFSHFIGTTISVLGVILSLYGYLNQSNDKDSKNLFYGILLCVGCSLFYSLSSIVQEINFKSGTDIYDFFPWFGFIGMAITSIEAFFLKNFESFADNSDKLDVNVILLILAASGTLVIYVSIVPFFIKRLSASMFNISQVSQIFWSFLIGKFFYDQNSNVLFILKAE